MEMESPPVDSLTLGCPGDAALVSPGRTRATRSPTLQRDLAAIGVGWKVVPDTGHPMGLQNPEGLAQAVADVLPASWT